MTSHLSIGKAVIGWNIHMVGWLEIRQHNSTIILKVSWSYELRQKTWNVGKDTTGVKKKMFVSGNPTLPSKTPPTLKFLLDFEKNILKMEKISKKRVYSPIFKQKTNKNKTYRPYLKIFRPLT